MAALSEMSPAEQQLHGHSKNKERFVKATRFIRELTIGRAYTLREELDACKTQEERDAILLDWGEEAGKDSGALKDDLTWTGAIKQDDLHGAFIAERIEDHEWQKRIGVSHLRRIGKAYDIKTGDIPTSEERCALVLECYHANWSVKELETELVRRGLRKPPKPRMKTLPSKTTSTADALLIALGEHLQRQGIDFDLTLKPGAFTQARAVSKTLRRLADTFDQLYPGLTFMLEEAKPGDQVQ